MADKVGEGKSYLNKEMKNKTHPYHQGVVKIRGELLFMKVYMNRTKDGNPCLGYTFEEYKKKSEE